MVVKYQYVLVTRYYCCFHCFCVQVLHLVAGGAVHRLDPHHTADDGRSALYLYSGQLYIYIYQYSGQLYIYIQVTSISIFIIQVCSISIFRCALYLYSGQIYIYIYINIQVSSLSIFRSDLYLYSGLL